MNLKNKNLLIISVVLLSTTLSADKPVWAGNDDKPSDYEKREHKEDMTSKHKYKKHYKEDEEYSERREYDSRETTYRKKYEGQGQTDKDFIEEKADETKKNWIGKFFDFLK